MTIRVIFESPESATEEGGHSGNERYLCQSDESRFPVLSQVDQASYAVFSAADMNCLLSELDALGHESVSERREIARLAARCLNEKGATLTFTPFNGYVRHRNSCSWLAVQPPHPRPFSPRSTVGRRESEIGQTITQAFACWRSLCLGFRVAARWA